MIMENKDLNYGISLIQLIITIIVIVILASTTISILVNNNIITSSKEVVSEYNASQVKEKLIVLLSKAQVEKYNNVGYNLREFLENEEQEISFIDDDTLLYYGYMFEIDSDTLQIKEIIDKEQKEENIVIACDQEINSDYTKATININVTSDNTIDKVVINGTETDVNNTSYSGNLELDDNGIYSIMAYVGEKYNYATVKVTEISEDMVITTADELKWFRDRVDKGATYVGKTIKLANDIVLNSEEKYEKKNGTITFLDTAEKWNPIGEYSGANLAATNNKVFKGTFDGCGYEIDGLYIYNENITWPDRCQALFSLVSEGTIKNVIIGSNSKIKGTANGTASLVGYLYNSATVENCNTKANVEGDNYVGGLVGLTENSIIKNSYNKGIVNGNGGYIGGLVGANQNNSQILTSYNDGKITAVHTVGGIVGWNDNSSTINSAYNTGVITSIASESVASTGGIVGYNNSDSLVINCYNAGDITSASPEVGGIIGSDPSVKNAKNIFNVGTVKKDSITATSDLGSVSDFVGCLIGRYGSCEGKFGNVVKNVMKGWTISDIQNNIGTNFKKDTQNINDGLPILSWQ